MEQLRPEPACIVQVVDDKCLLVAERAALRTFGNGCRHAMWQWTDPRVGEENFIAGDGEFTPAKFLVGEQFGQCHGAKLIREGPARKAELKSFYDVGKVAVWTIETGIELDDLVGNKQYDQEVN